MSSVHTKVLLGSKRRGKTPESIIPRSRIIWFKDRKIDFDVYLFFSVTFIVVVPTVVLVIVLVVVRTGG